VKARDWARDLDLALELRPNHLSVYGLTVEPQTPLGRWTARGQVSEAPEERYEQEFLLAHERLSAAGFEHYEVSNYGLPGHRAIHNSSYWTGAPYLGLGPAAHGFDGERRRWNRPAYAHWLEAVRAGADPLAGEESLGEAERTAEAVYLGLRTIDGLNLRQDEWMTVTAWIDAGWATRRGDVLVLSALGWLRLDALAASLTSLRSHS
jgi:oxygen-independent coproporphyrinogen-3 oxidase